jgi:hypothetical protein
MSYVQLCAADICMYIHMEYAVLKSPSSYAFFAAYMKRDFDSNFLQILDILCHFGIRVYRISYIFWHTFLRMYVFSGKNVPLV